MNFVTSFAHTAPSTKPHCESFLFCYIFHISNISKVFKMRCHEIKFKYNIFDVARVLNDPRRHKVNRCRVVLPACKPIPRTSANPHNDSITTRWCIYTIIRPWHMTSINHISCEYKVHCFITIACIRAKVAQDKLHFNIVF